MTAAGAGVHFYRSAQINRVAANDLRVIRSLTCPDCGGFLNRLAYRDTINESRPWVPIGYTCSKCAMMFCEAAK